MHCSILKITRCQIKLKVHLHVPKKIFILALSQSPQIAFFLYCFSSATSFLLTQHLSFTRFCSSLTANLSSSLPLPACTTEVELSFAQYGDVRTAVDRISSPAYAIEAVTFNDYYYLLLSEEGKRCVFYLNFSSNGMRHPHHVCWLEKNGNKKTCF